MCSIIKINIVILLRMNKQSKKLKTYVNFLDSYSLAIISYIKKFTGKRQQENNPVKTTLLAVTK